MVTVVCSHPPAGAKRLSSHFLRQSALVGALSIVGVLLGVVPSWQPSDAPSDANVTGSSWGKVSFSTTAHAQSVSDQEVQNYARSVLAIEPLRQEAYESIKNINGSVPPIMCHLPDSLNDLPSNIRQIAVDYCDQATAIVSRNNLSISRFNAITSALRSDSALSDRIQQALMQMQ